MISNFIGKIWISIIQIGFVPLYIQYLGIESYGIIGFFALIQSWLMLLDAGITPALSREMAYFNSGNYDSDSIRDLLKSVEVIMLTSAVFIFTALAFLSEWFATSWLNLQNSPINEVVFALIIMSFVAALRFLETVYNSSLVGLQKQVSLNTINVISVTLRSVGAIFVLKYISSSLIAFFVWQSIILLISTFFLRRVTYNYLPSGSRKSVFSWASIEKVRRFAIGVFLLTISSMMISKIDKIILSNQLTIAEFGYYTMGVLVASISSMIVFPITQAFYPKFCELLNNNELPELTEIFHKAAQLITVLVGTASLTFIYYSDSIIFLWTQDAEITSNVSSLVVLLSIGNVLNAFNIIPYQVILGSGKTRLLLYFNFIGFVIMLPALLIVVPTYGAIGAAWLWILYNSFYLLITPHYIYKLILHYEKWRWYAFDIFVPFMTSLLSMGLISLYYDTIQNIFYKVLIIIISILVSLATSTAASNKLRTIVFFKIKSIEIK